MCQVSVLALISGYIHFILINKYLIKSQTPKLKQIHLNVFLCQPPAIPALMSLDCDSPDKEEGAIRGRNGILNYIIFISDINKWMQCSRSSVIWSALQVFLSTQMTNTHVFSIVKLGTQTLTKNANSAGNTSQRMLKDTLICARQSKACPISTDALCATTRFVFF